MTGSLAMALMIPSAKVSTVLSLAPAKQRSPADLTSLERVPLPGEQSVVRDVVRKLDLFRNSVTAGATTVPTVVRAKLATAMTGSLAMALMIPSAKVSTPRPPASPRRLAGNPGLGICPQELGLGRYGR
jgi:hypothetical protein